MLIASGLCFSTEVDNFTDVHPPLEDGREGLNALMADHMRQAVQNANLAGSCNPSVIEHSLIAEFGGSIGRMLWSTLEKDLETADHIDRRRSAVADSIYGGVHFWDGMCLHVGQLGFTMRVGDNIIGSDKIGHFLHIGHQYYLKSYTYAGGIDAAMSYGEYTERTYYGLQTSGVYSYGDLVADLEGMHFWQRVLNTDLKKGVSPYFQCEDNIWTQITEFDWADYVNPAWDESLNCSRFSTERMTSSVEERITQRGLTCPGKPHRCEEMIAHYGHLSPRLITPRCFQQ